MIIVESISIDIDIDFNWTNIISIVVPILDQKI